MHFLETALNPHFNAFLRAKRLEVWMALSFTLSQIFTSYWHIPSSIELVIFSSKLFVGCREEWFKADTACLCRFVLAPKMIISINMMRCHGALMEYFLDGWGKISFPRGGGPTLENPKNVWGWQYAVSPWIVRKSIQEIFQNRTTYASPFNKLALCKSWHA